MTLSDLKDVVDILFSLFQMVAVTVGGIWAYLVFVRHRERYPRATLQHQVTYRQVDPIHGLLTIDLVVSNPSTILLSLSEKATTVSQVLPPQAELSRRWHDAPRFEVTEWKHLLEPIREQWEPGELELEPGESHQFHHDIVISTEAQTVMVESFIRNIAKRKRLMGWSLITIHDVSAARS